ncbi:OpgC domain-containing protein [Bradyrhizobium sp. Ash2021]|nr:OpgC domain-containing protein [Bradyrhizobium sp. Ash2021]
MRLCADPPPAARDVRLDLFRGLANWAIFLDHIPHEVLSWTTIKHYGFSDAAVFWLAIATLVFSFVVTMAIRTPDLGGLVPHWILQPFHPNDKTYLAPHRIVHFIALAVVVTRFLPVDSPILQWRSLAPLIKCGRNSLQVFCTGIVLSFCAHAAIELSLNSLWVQILVGATGILLMTAIAYCWTWPKRRNRMLPSHARLGGIA